jgi:hypothetical protein
MRCLRDEPFEVYGIGGMKDEAGPHSMRRHKRFVGRHGRRDEHPARAEHCVRALLRPSSDRIKDDVDIRDLVSKTLRAIVDDLIGT